MTTKTPEILAPGAWNPAKVKAFRAAFEAFLKVVKIDSKEAGGGYVLADRVYDAQRIVLDSIFEGLAADVHSFDILKSRQLGISTITRALIVFWLGFFKGMKGGLVFDTGDHKEEARRDIEALIDALPDGVKFPRIKTRNRSMLILENGSTLLFMAAGVKKGKSSGTLGRGSGLNLLWCSEMCQPPDARIITAAGREVRMRDIRVGSIVRTHTGASALVKAIIRSENTRPMVRVVPEIGMPEIMTFDHEVVTPAGKIPASALEKGDWLVLPIRKITREMTESRARTRIGRLDHGGQEAVGAGAAIPLNEEMGFAVGYYLAEGTVLFQERSPQPKIRPSGIAFTRHRNEKHYCDRAVAALAPYLSAARRIEDKATCLTSVETVYGASIAAWLADTFGCDERKHIPDEVFAWGEDFCKGLLTGLLAGDGSKTLKTNRKYKQNSCALSTTRSSLAYQARDLAAALGVGWGGISHQDGGDRYGRNCKEIWTLRWNGPAAATLREWMGLETAPTGSRRGVERYRMEPGRVLIRVRGVRQSEDCPEVYDITVDHPDHTFQNSGFAVSNCSWENDEGVKSLESSIAKQFPDRLYVWESTARGPNIRKEMWENALADDLRWRAIFVGWWAHPGQKLLRGTPAYERYAAAPLSALEKKRIQQVQELYGWEISDEQLAWYRQLVDPNAEGEDDAREYVDDDLTRQDQPWTADEAFVLSGSTFFPTEAINDRMQHTVSSKYTGYKFYPGTDFISTRVETVRSAREIMLKVWQEPHSQGEYILSFDVAFGHNENNDRSAFQILRCYADKIEQVAEFASASTPTDHYAWVILHCVAWYKNVFMIGELNGPGEAVFKAYQETMKLMKTGYQRAEAKAAGLGNVFDNVRQFIYARPDSLSDGSVLHFKTTSQLKVTIFERLRDDLCGKRLDIASIATLSEMKDIVRNGDEIKGEGKTKDDRAFALALGSWAWHEKIRRKMSSQNRTKAAEIARERQSVGDQVKMFNQYTMTSFFARKEIVRKAQERAENRASWKGRR